jgi:hypothetical protein
VRHIDLCIDELTAADPAYCALTAVFDPSPPRECPYFADRAARSLIEQHLPAPGHHSAESSLAALNNLYPEL